jgi:DNA-binding GntR family transcriptional regulator
MMDMDLRRSVPAGIARVLTERILSGAIAPDAPLREAELAEEFTASRNTIREALVRLEHEGLVRKNAHRGSRVLLPAAAEVREILALRRIVEPGAVRTLAASPSDLGALRECARQMERAAAQEDWVGYGQLDLAFHSGLVASAGSARLAEEFARSIRPLQLRLLAADRSAPAQGSRARVLEHGMLLHAIETRAVSAALDLIDKHLRDSEAALFG